MALQHQAAPVQPYNVSSTNAIYLGTMNYSHKNRTCLLICQLESIREKVSKHLSGDWNNIGWFLNDISLQCRDIDKMASMEHGREIWAKQEWKHLGKRYWCWFDRHRQESQLGRDIHQQLQPQQSWLWRNCAIQVQGKHCKWYQLISIPIVLK